MHIFQISTIPRNVKQISKVLLSFVKKQSTKGTFLENMSILLAIAQAFTIALLVTLLRKNR
ncbi:hypothetical protein EEL32_06845 [Brevibacillus laterosporus]|nr:hypothetical protein EEL32_06845 [Brevibacillus laterosporus]